MNTKTYIAGIAPMSTEYNTSKTTDERKPSARKKASYLEAKKAYRSRRGFFQHVKDAGLIGVGSLSAGFGLKSMLLPNRFIDGGATGISLLVTKISGYPLSLIIVIVNLPFILLGFRQIGKAFTLKTALGIFGLALCLTFIEYPTLTNDKLLVAVFGGFFLGAGIGFAIRGGGVLDGTEVLAIYVSRKTGATIGDVILVVNVIIFTAAVYFLGIESALYSMLTYLSASRTVDFFVEGIDEYFGVTIITHKSGEIRRAITEKMGRGYTIYRGAGGYGKQGHVSKDMDIIFTVVTRLEVSRLQNEISIIDEDAFVVMNAVKDTRGGMIKKRPAEKLIKPDHPASTERSR
jgi:uncharacterized membrane-anchored protein YitT (DUF2179 family)